MAQHQHKRAPRTAGPRQFLVLGTLGLFLLGFILAYVLAYGLELPRDPLQFTRGITHIPKAPPPQLDKIAYDKKLLEIANYGAISSTTPPAEYAHLTASSTRPWPVKNLPYPKAGALLPFHRIVAYYGNFLSKGMGVLGQYPPEEMLSRLRATVAEWQEADPATPVIPAIHYIAVTAQAAAGADGKYRARMPDEEVDKALALAAEVHGILFLDVQVGLSTVETEVPLLGKYLKMPNVELGIDPEFAMHGGAKPGRLIGSLDAEDINFAAEYLAGLVKQYDLPPKILMIHRFTEDMVTNYKHITPLPEVQIVMDMDGWGDQAKKIGTYTWVVAAEPVQFTGFKLFYKNDLLPPSMGMMTPQQILQLQPQPIYIQYQ